MASNTQRTRRPPPRARYRVDQHVGHLAGLKM
jgi:hypothetical protein